MRVSYLRRSWINWKFSRICVNKIKQYTIGYFPLTSLTIVGVMGWQFWSMAPSATMMIFKRCPLLRSWASFWHNLSFQSAPGGHSGMKTKSASVARDATSARYLSLIQSKIIMRQFKNKRRCSAISYPQCRPITSKTKHLWWLKENTGRYKTIIIVWFLHYFKQIKTKL